MINPFDLYWYVTVNTSELLKLKLTAAGFFFRRIPNYLVLT